jgi:hypothetical protein
MSTVVADAKRRISLPHAQPGDRFDLQTDIEGRIILRRLVPKPKDLVKETPQVRLKRDKQGRSFFPIRCTVEDIAKAVRAERDSR